MSEQISAMLKRKLDDLAVYGGIDAAAKANALKEALQYFVLNFIYHHSEYSNWIMYGGSALRIIHGLDRMSVDLDFEIDREVESGFLSDLKKEVEKYFANTHSVQPDFLTIKINNKRGLTLKFLVGGLVTGYPSEWVHVKIDLNHFTAPKTVVERRPINRDQLSFVIKTYNMSALMASKIAAIFLRDQRGVDKNIYDYKGRDIYDLLWYMNKKAEPDFDYLNAKLKTKGVGMPDIKALFRKLTIDILNYEKMDDLLKDDLKFLFENQFQFENWFNNWRKEYLRLLDDYKIRTVTALESAGVHQKIPHGPFSFVYWYDTEEGERVSITYKLGEYWIRYREGELPVAVDDMIRNMVEFNSNGMRGGTRVTRMSSAQQEKLLQYATLFFQKTENYFKKTNRIMLGDTITTKLIRMSADDLNQKEEILLTKPALLSCELDDLLQ